MPSVTEHLQRKRRHASRPAFTACRRRSGTSQRGAVVVLVAAFLMLDLIIAGLVLDVGSLFHRNLELQGIANNAALAAVKELDGTVDGVNRARTAAASAANRSQVRYHSPNRGQTQVWQEAALTLASSSSGPWLSPDAAAAAPAAISFARVDTSQLDPSAGTVVLILLRLLPGSPASATTSARAISGHTGLNITPLAICAMSPAAAAPRTNPGPPAKVELVEFGFRRGVSYDLMNLNPGGATPETFAVDPITLPGGMSGAAYTDAASLGPFICSGRLAIPSVMAAPIRVARPFPLAALFAHLNTRFDQYGGTSCTANGAPPDRNIKSFTYNVATYMNPRQTLQAPATAIIGGTRLTNISEPQPVPSGTTNTMYGPLWTYSQAVPYSAYVPGKAEPDGGYAVFDYAAWSTLYSTGQPITASLSQLYQPYNALVGGYFQGPAANHHGLKKRRVLNLPLLACPVAAGSTAGAQVLGIGRFFMTVPATATNLHAEFAGIVPEQRVVSRLELLQ